MSDDDQRPPFNRPAAHLLDELEAIRGSLTEGLDIDDDTAGDIPLLDDMVIHNLDRNASLLDISQIFDDQLNDDRHREEIAPALQSMQFPRFTLDVTISDDPDIAQDPFAKTVDAPPTADAAQPQRLRHDYHREMLIQELIDEFIPQIEARLHDRLCQLDDIVLRRLKDVK